MKVLKRMLRILYLLMTIIQNSYVTCMSRFSVVCHAAAGELISIRGCQVVQSHGWGIDVMHACREGQMLQTHACCKCSAKPKSCIVWLWLEVFKVDKMKESKWNAYIPPRSLLCSWRVVSGCEQLITQCHSVANSISYFQRRLFVCVCVCSLTQ